MKSIFVLLMLASLCGNAQELESVWGLKFGISKDSAKKIVNKKTGKLPEASQVKDVVMYKKCQFGGQDAYLIKLSFYQNKLYGCEVDFIPDKEPQLLSLYRTLQNSITSKWFSPQYDVEDYKYPYKKENEEGERVIAITGGYATIMSVWVFPRTADRNMKGAITLNVNSGGYIELLYIDGEISKDAAAQSNNTNSNDF